MLVFGKMRFRAILALLERAFETRKRTLRGAHSQLIRSAFGTASRSHNTVFTVHPLFGSVLPLIPS